MQLCWFCAILFIVSGCASEVARPARPRPILYLTPSAFVYHIASGDHIVVTNRPTGQQVPTRVETYSLTITGQEMAEIVHAISSLQTSINNYVPDLPSSFKWQLQFYRGEALLGTLDLSADSVSDGGWEYHAPRILRQLYHRVTKESARKE